MSNAIAADLSIDKMKLAGQQTLEDTPNRFVFAFGALMTSSRRTITFNRNNSKTILIYSDFLLWLSK